MIYKSKQNTFHMDDSLIKRIEESLNSGYAVTITNKGNMIDFSYRSRVHNGYAHYNWPENIHLPNSTVAFVEEIINGGKVMDTLGLEKNGFSNAPACPNRNITRHLNFWKASASSIEPNKG